VETAITRPNPVGDGTKWRVDTSVCHDKENRNSGPAVLTRGFDAPFGPFGASSCLFLELFDTGACVNPDSARRLVYFLSYMCGPKGRVQTTRFRPRNCGSGVPILLIVTQCAVLAPYKSGALDSRMVCFLRHRGSSPVALRPKVRSTLLSDISTERAFSGCLRFQSNVLIFI